MGGKVPHDTTDNRLPSIERPSFATTIREVVELGGFEPPTCIAHRGGEGWRVGVLHCATSCATVPLPALSNSLIQMSMQESA
jgi:hypothetical protein